jgi:beta-phosphoglucomutase-like phosphatase (HAD superfamily)
MRAIKAMVLDMHGVLIFEFPVGPYHEAVRRYFDLDEYERLKSRLGTGAMVFASQGLRKEYVELLNSMPVKPLKEGEIVGLLEALATKIDIYIATDTARQNCIDSLTAAGYRPELFKKILTIEDVELPKPSPEIFLKIGVNESFVAVGDRHTDIQAAVELGALGVKVSSREDTIALFRTLLRMA